MHLRESWVVGIGPEPVRLAIGLRDAFSSLGMEVRTVSDPGEWLSSMAASFRPCAYFAFISSDYDVVQLREVKENSPESTVICILGGGDSQLARQCILAEASGIIDVDCTSEGLARILEAAAHHEVLVSRTMAAAISQTPQYETSAQPLEDHEVVILRRLRQNRTVDSIARELGRSERTIFRTFKRIHRKLQVDSTREAMTKAHRNGWI